MQLRYFSFLFLALISLACKKETSSPLPPSVAIEKKKIDSLEAIFKIHSDKGLQDSILDDALFLTEAYANYAYLAPNDTISPILMMRRGQIFSGLLGNHKKAGEIFNQVWSRYPKFYGRPMALLMAANAWYSAGDSLETKNVTKTFLAQYPNHPLEKDILSIELLMAQKADPSLEEFAKNAIEKAKQDSLKKRKGA